MRHRACTHKTFGAHVCLAPNSGVRADIPGPPLWAKLGHRRTPAAMLKPALLYRSRYAVSATSNVASFAQKEP
jgi:hypothetical protein